MLGALLTALYTFRLIFRVFFGPLGTPVTKRPGYAMTVPLVVLAFLSIVGGYLKEPLLGFLHSALPPTIEAHTGGSDRDSLRGHRRISVPDRPLLCLSVPPPEAKPGGRSGREPRRTHAARMVVCGLGLRLDLRQSFCAALRLGGTNQQERFRRCLLYRRCASWRNCCIAG